MLRTGKLQKDISSNSNAGQDKKLTGMLVLRLKFTLYLSISLFNIALYYSLMESHYKEKFTLAT